MRYSVYRAAFETLALTGVSPLIRRVSRAKGVIFTLHRVLPDAPAAFSPNAILQVTPEFLEAAIVKTRAAGFDIVDLDEAARRIEAPEKTKPFVVFTFDDAYRDNLQYALPILKKHNVPFTLFVSTALTDGKAEVWWLALEDIVAASTVVVIPERSGPRYADAATLAQKQKLYDELYARHRTMPEPRRVEALHALADRAGLDLGAHCRSLIMNWAELATFADDPLCAIGAHTVHHYELSKLPEDTMRFEIDRSRSIIKAQFGKAPAHFSYPIGSPVAAGPREFAAVKELGFRTAVTTRPGGLYHEHAGHLEALPRISLNGRFQKERFLDVFLTGAIFSMLAGGKVNVG
ncbi:polysaccharide deacetylase family protein [Pelagibacterium halotolerans]|uniref:polysaccharide deacetylase family protein n=1 Tax=Pelagibacterium halotolerans TaxID=531813 RepID=UPI00384A5058